MVRLEVALCFLISIAWNAVCTEAVVTSEGCETGKSCLYIPAGCDLSSTNCRFASWSMSAAPDSIDIELRSAKVSQNDSYIAFAFGTEPAMTNADLYFCTQYDLGNGVMKKRYADPEEMPLENGLSAESVGLIDGRIHCKFTRPLAVTKAIISGDHDFNLAANEYYLLMAQGKVQGGVLTYHEWKDFTPERINFVANFKEASPTIQPGVHQPQVDSQTTPESPDSKANKTAPEPATKAEPKLPMKATTPEPEPEGTTSGSRSVFIASWTLSLITTITMALCFMQSSGSYI